MKKRIIAGITVMLTVVAMCFAITTRERLEISSEGYHFGYYNGSGYNSSTVTNQVPPYYKKDSEKKDAWQAGCSRGFSDKRNGNEYDDPYMKQLQSACFE